MILSRLVMRSFPDIELRIECKKRFTAKITNSIVQLSGFLQGLRHLFDAFVNRRQAAHLLSQSNRYCGATFDPLSFVLARLEKHW
jgi:hypothetical protein